MFRRVVGPGVEICQVDMGDAEALFELTGRNREYLRPWLPWVDLTFSVEDVREYIARARAQFEADQGPNTGIWVDGSLAGSIGCHPIDLANRNCSLGYWVDAGQQGKGLITRCCAAMLDYLFDELDLHRVEIRCGTQNFRSCAVPARLGFTREGVAREAEWVMDRWVDLVVWAILREDWQGRRKQ